MQEKFATGKKDLDDFTNKTNAVNKDHEEALKQKKIEAKFVDEFNTNKFIFDQRGVKDRESKLKK